MVKLCEFRMTMPMSCEEYQRGQQYTIMEVSKKETGGGSGITIQKQEPYEHPTLGKGKYTEKTYHLEDKVPTFLRVLMPKGSLTLKEESWSCFPYCKTIITNPTYMKDDFLLQLETWHKDGPGTIDNVHDLDEKRLKQRTVDHVDICNDKVSKSLYDAELDPTKVEGPRSPLASDWQATQPADAKMMTAYKLVTFKFKWFGLQNKIESWMMTKEREIFLMFHREIVAKCADWIDLTPEQIEEMERQVALELEASLNEGEVKGYSAEDES